MQDPYNTQNFNRYSYCLNNPFKYTDWTGENWWDRNWKSVFTAVAGVATAVVIVASLGTATPLVTAMWASAGAGFVGGTLGTYLNGGTIGQIVLAGFSGALLGAATGYAGAYLSAAAGAVGIIPGALSGAAISSTLGAMTNVITGKNWSDGIGMMAVFGAVGGGVSGFSAAKANGSGIWFGTTAKPSATVLAGNINAQTAKAQAAYDKSTQVQTEPTGMQKYYPENDGAIKGTEGTKYLYEGDTFDRFGTPTNNSNYVSPANTPKSLRFLPSNNDGVYSQYKVLKPFPVQTSQIAPFGGTQYRTPLPLNLLEKKGIILKIN